MYILVYHNDVCDFINWNGVMLENMCLFAELQTVPFSDWTCMVILAEKMFCIFMVPNMQQPNWLISQASCPVGDT